MQALLDFLKYLATSNTINFILMVGILYWIIKKIDLNNIFESGIKKIQSDIQNSENKKEASKHELDKAKAILDGLPKDIETLDNNCNEKINIFKEQIKTNTKNNITKINSDIERVIAVDEKKISKLILEEAAKDSVLKAESDIINLLKEKPELHDKFIQNSIDELDKVNIQ